MLRHIVVFRWTADASEEQKQAVADELRKLPSSIPEVQELHVGPDAGIIPGNFDFAVVADFADQHGYLTYREHKAHRAVVEQYIQPIAAERAAVQYEL
jgi:hypothetical protein